MSTSRSSSASNRRLASAALAAWLCAVGPARADSVYDALGGGPGIDCIVGGLFERNLSDPRIKDKFSDINIARLKQRIAAHFCTVSGGPCQFKGISMKGAHSYLELHQYHFDALVENLQGAMDQCRVGFHAQNRFLALLAPMERDVVSK